MNFGMQPQTLLVDLTQHKDVILNDSFKLHQVTITSQALLSEGKPLVDGELYIDGLNSGIKTSSDGSFVLPTATSGSHKFEIKSKNVYFEEKSVNIDLSSSSCLVENSASNQKLLSLTSFKAYSFDVCGQIKMLKDQETYLNEITKSVQINIFKVDKSTTGLKMYKTTSLNTNLQYCVQLEVNSEYVIRADLTPSLAQIIKLMPVEQKIKVTDSPVMNVNFEQMEAKLDVVVSLLSKSEVPNDLKLTIRLDDPKRTWTREILTQCNKEILKNQEGQIQSESIKCKLSLTNLLFGNYLIATNYDDLFCWLKKDSINVNSEHQMYLLEQSGYLLNYELSHKNTLIKIVENNDQVLFSKNVLNDNDLISKICLPAAKDYKLLVESRYKYTTSDSDIDTFHIESVMFKKNLNKIILKALKTQVIIDVVFKFENKLEKQRVTSEDLFVQVKVDSLPTEIQLVKFKLKSETENQLLFTSKSWFASNQLLHLHAKSNKILFENNLKDLKVNELNSDLNYVQFEAKLGIFLDVTVQPNDIDDISLVLKSTLDDSILSQETINAAQGFKIGPVKPPFSNYNIELSKSGYLFTKLPLSDVAKNVDTFKFDFSAEKLGQLKVNVINSVLKTNLENVLLSLSSENRLFRQTSKTDLNGQASFDNLKPGLYYLILMMQEYEFVPNSHPIQISDGFHMNLVVEANRVAYSCFGKVSSVNGQVENGITVQAIGLKSSTDNEADNEACKSIQENSQIENVDLGNYRIYNLKPNCEYMLSLKQQQENNFFKIVPDNYVVYVNNSDLIGKNFVVLHQIEKVDITLAVSFKSALTPIINTKQLTNYVRVKLFKTSQTSTVLQTQFALANSIVYFNSVPRDTSQQYSIQVELLSASTVSLLGGSLTNQQQQQLQQLPVIESVELSFYSDSAHKHLLVDFDLDKKNFAFGFDFKQQQYQNFYFTLPLFILVIGLFLNSKRVQIYLQQIYSQIEQKGGFVMYFQSLTGTAKTTVATASTQKSSKSSYKANYREANASDHEKSNRKEGGNRSAEDTDSDVQTINRRKTKKAE